MGRSHLSPVPYVSGHLRGLRSTDGTIPARTVAELYLLPLLAGAVVGGLGLQISDGAAQALLTVTGLFAAFGFQLSVELVMRASTLAEARAETPRNASRHAEMIRMLLASASYATLVSVAAAGACIAVLVTSGVAGQILDGIATALCVHLGLTLLLLLRRMSLYATNRLVLHDSQQSSDRDAA